MSEPKLKLKKCLPCDVVEGTPGPWHDTRIIKNKFEAFLLYIDEDMISKIVKRTKEPMHKVCKKINAEEFLQPTKEFWYDTCKKYLKGCNVFKYI